MSRARLRQPCAKTTFTAVVPDSSELELPVLVDQLAFRCASKVKDKNRKWWKSLAYAFSGVEWLELVKTI